MNAPLFNADTAAWLLAWFEKEGKAYPWGDNISPYRVWVSEIMLQQTVVTAVVPYFTRWMKRFPTPLDLAEAEEEEVLRYWEGLGYYSRGRNLLKAARYVRDRLNGQLPGDLEGWKALPGVGDYTARAVLSIALGQPYPVLDANVRRIGQRILGRRNWPRGADRELLTALEKTIPHRDPGKFNAAMMQLGQLVCRTGTPLCASCPLRPGCVAAAEGTAAEIPQRQKRTQTILMSRRFLLIREGRILMIRRDHGIGRGLWVLPGMDAAGEAAAGTGEGAAADPRGFPWGAGSVLIQMVKGKSSLPLKTRRHTYTRYREELSVEVVRWVNPEGAAEGPRTGEETGQDVPGMAAYPAGPGGKSLEQLVRLYAGNGWEARWFSPGEIGRLPLPAVYRKILDEATG